MKHIKHIRFVDSNYTLALTKFPKYTGLVISYEGWIQHYENGKVRQGRVRY